MTILRPRIEIIEENVRLRGNVELIVRENDLVVHRERCKNTITTVGLNRIRDMLLGVNGKYPRAISAGTDDGTILPKGAANTQLGDEKFRKIIARRDEGTAQATWQMLMLKAEGNGFTYREMGLEKNLVKGAGTEALFSRAFHNAVNKTSLVDITYKWSYGIAGS